MSDNQMTFPSGAPVDDALAPFIKASQEKAEQTQREWKQSGFNHETKGAGNVAGSDTWLTPKYIVEPLGTFDLDPCAAPEPRPWEFAPNNYDLTLGLDGLVEPWEGRIWCNPPYGSEAGKFMDKLSTHLGGGIGLIFARTETGVWQKIIWPRATAILFLQGRLSFYDAKGVKGGTAGSPSALVAFTSADAEVLLKCGHKGCLVWGRTMIR